MTVLRALAAGSLLAVAVVAIDATPAAAHGAGGLDPTDYETVVRSITPRVDGLAVRSVDLGDRLELTNTSGTPVVVLGYDGEPYLRVGPGGAFENRRSPAVFLNRERRTFGEVPASADAGADPRWRRTGDGPTVRWHDHRAHWMGRDDPPAVQRDPDVARVVQPFTIELLHGTQTIEVTGAVRFVPGPSPWPWVAGALVLAAGLVIAGRGARLGAAMVVGLALLVGAQVVHVVGLWGGTTAGVGSRLGASAYSLAGVALAALALGVLVRRGAYAGAPVALLAGLFLLLSGGLADVSVLARSQVATTLPAWADRATVAITIGTGTALVVLGVLRLWRATPPPIVVDGPVAPTGAVVPPAIQARYRPPGSTADAD